MLKSLLAWTLLIGIASAADPDYQAITNADAAIRSAPSKAAEQIGVVPSGVSLDVTVCFDEGVYCFVTSPDYEGYVAGDLLTIRGEMSTVLAAEGARWALYRRNSGTATTDELEAGNIVAWGDSLSQYGFGPELARLLDRDVSMQGIPGQNGTMIAERMLADTRYVSRFKILWDRHWSRESTDHYIAGIKPMAEYAAKTGDFIILSDIRQLTTSDSVDSATDRQITEAINSELARLYPSHFLDVTAILEAPETRAADGLHLSPLGDSAVAKALAEEIAAREKTIGRP